MTKRAEYYQREWEATLRSRGITPNGETSRERFAQERLATFRANKLARGRTLKEAAAAFERAKRKGYVRLHPERGFIVVRGRGF